MKIQLISPQYQGYIFKNQEDIKSQQSLPHFYNKAVHQQLLDNYDENKHKIDFQYRDPFGKTLTFQQQLYDAKLFETKGQGSGNQPDSRPREAVTIVVEEGKCQICLCEYDSGDEIKVLQCNHKFHLFCITPWEEKLKSDNKAITCSICNGQSTENFKIINY